MMQSPDLFRLLAAGNTMAILTDYVWFECYKQESLPAVRAFLSIACQFPDRIAMLRSGASLAGLDPRQKGYRALFELPGAGDDLPAMVAAIEGAERGEPAVLEQLRRRWEHAAATMSGMLEGTADIIPSLPEIATIFTTEETRRCRAGQKYTPVMTEKVFLSAHQIYEVLTEMDGRLPVLDPRFAVQTFYYRFAIGVMMHCLWWIQHGSQPIGRADRLRNDYIDLGLTVCATYYDGLMTNDTKAAWMHREMSNALAFAGSVAAKL